MCVPKSLDPSLYGFVISSHFWQELLPEKNLFLHLEKKTIATNPLNHCIESSIPPCQFSFSPWFFFRFRPINAILFQFSMSILPLVNETIQWFRFIEIYFTFDYRYCVRFSTLLSVSSSGEHNFLEFFFLHSLSSLFFYFFFYISFCFSILGQNSAREWKKRMCASFFGTHWHRRMICVMLELGMWLL